jgi:predicted transcriptional regulator
MGEVELPDDIEAELKKEAAKRDMTPDQLAGTAVDHVAEAEEEPAAAEDELDPPLAGEEGEPPPAG